jgi:prepilin-type N-terminal cleavage/methylation domain-containing protein
MSAAERARRPQGFTLIEVVVALVIFGLAFAVVARIIQTDVLQSGRAEKLNTATLLARSQLARIGADVPVAAGELDGDAGDGFRWRIVIRPAQLDDEPGDQAGGSDRPPEVLPYQVEVTVAWDAGEPAEAVTLTSLRLAAAEPAR